MTGIVLCRPDTFWLRAVNYCPTCDRRRRMVGMDQFWYGLTWTCVACGDSWTDGRRLPRPFRRGWRKDAIREARKRWADAGNRVEHRAWTDDQYKQHRQFQQAIEGSVG